LLINYSVDWIKGTLLGSSHSWISDEFVLEHKALPYFFLWSLWLSRNKMFFRDIPLNIAQMAHSIKLSYREHWKAPPSKLPRSLMHPVINTSFAWGFFDGPCQNTPGKYGARVIVHIFSMHFISLKYGASPGSNNRAKLLAMWLLLKTATGKRIKKLQVLGKLQTAY
jgi:hypothetical protein